VALDQAVGSGLAAALAVAVGLGLGSVVAVGPGAAEVFVAGRAAAVGLGSGAPQCQASASPARMLHRPLPRKLQPSGGCIGGERKGCEASPWYVGAGQPSALHGHFAAPCLYSHGE
jgi:hypothetical protein